MVPEELVETSTTYLSDGGESLPLLLVSPRGRQPRAGIVFFHGGGWIGGGPEQFLPQCRALADAGVLSATAGYRLIGQGAPTLADCVADARAAIRRFAALAADHGLLPSVLAAGGGSAGAHLAMVATMAQNGMGHDAGPHGSDAGQDRGRDRADALPAGEVSTLGGLVLFNPAVDLSSLDPPFLDMLRQGAGMSETDLVQMSPLNMVRPDCPPVLLFHGTNDAVVPLDSVRAFRDRMKAVGNRCQLIEFEGADHGFFNARADGNRFYDETVAMATEFLLALEQNASARCQPE